MTVSHPLLKRQLRKAGLSETSAPNGVEVWGGFLCVVDRTYTQADQDRAMLERSLELSSRELRELFDQVATHNHELEREVALRTEELEAARENDRRRMDQLEILVEQRTAELRHAALHDRLTSLPNRMLFYDRLHATLRRREQTAEGGFSLLFLDFDRFKVINDSLGHDYGDELLRQIAERLRRTLRDTDAVTQVESAGALAARLGGDEFCVLLEGLRADADALVVADRLLVSLAKPYMLKERTVSVTVSIGVTHGALGYASAEAMMRDADTAMYHAKHRGRGTIAVFDQDMHRAAMRRLVMESDIRHATARGQLRCVFQPIFSLTSGESTAAEVLLRWHHPEHGVISPADFIPLAEETGAIWEMGEWVLRRAVQAIEEIGSLQGAHKIERLTVNVSPRQCCDERFTGLVRSVLEESGIDPARLVLEITESSLKDNPDVARRTIHELRELGTRVFLDDFGAGYSSFGLLHTLPLDGLKLDRQFLDASDSLRRTAACIHSVVTLVRTLGMDLVAEGIESLSHVSLLQALGVELGQGYLFARPVPIDELRRFLEKPFRPQLQRLATPAV